MANDANAELLEWVREGLELGEKIYGPLDPIADEREWAHEALEEVRDALIYAGALLLRLRGGR